MALFGTALWLYLMYLKGAHWTERSGFLLLMKPASCCLEDIYFLWQCWFWGSLKKKKHYSQWVCLPSQEQITTWNVLKCLSNAWKLKSVFFSSIPSWTMLISTGWLENCISIDEKLFKEAHYIPVIFPFYSHYILLYKPMITPFWYHLLFLFNVQMPQVVAPCVTHHSSRGRMRRTCSSAWRGAPFGRPGRSC